MQSATEIGERVAAAMSVKGGAMWLLEAEQARACRGWPRSLLRLPCHLPHTQRNFLPLSPPSPERSITLYSKLSPLHYARGPHASAIPFL